MTKIYACLLGSWIDITDCGTVGDCQNPSLYFEEKLTYVPSSKVAKCFEYDYINVQYQGKNYRLHPSQIQIVTE